MKIKMANNDRKDMISFYLKEIDGDWCLMDPPNKMKPLKR